MLWPERPSLSYALMVIACEALQPSDADDRQNCYDVASALLGAPAVERICNTPHGVRPPLVATVSDATISTTHA
jgi:hypothetical protein